MDGRRGGAGAGRDACARKLSHLDRARRGDHRPVRPTALNERGLALVGARGIVAAPIVNGEGKVRLGDTVWIAEGPLLAVGAPVVVSAVRGTRLVVIAAAEAEIERAG